MKGQTVIEVLVALGAAVVIITAVSIAIITAINNANFSKNQNLATEYAQDGMEVLHHLRDSDYAAFKTYNGVYCLGKGDQTLGTAQVDCLTANVDDFIRKVTIEQNPGCGGGITKAVVEVKWSDSKCTGNTNFCHDVNLTSCFSDVNQLPTP